MTGDYALHAPIASAFACTMPASPPPTLFLKVDDSSTLSMSSISTLPMHLLPGHVVAGASFPLPPCDGHSRTYSHRAVSRLRFHFHSRCRLRSRFLETPRASRTCVSSFRTLRVFAASGPPRSALSCSQNGLMGACCGKSSSSSVAGLVGEGEEPVLQEVEVPSSPSTFSEPPEHSLTLPGDSKVETDTVASVPLIVDTADTCGAEEDLKYGDNSDELPSDLLPDLPERVWRQRGRVSGETLLRDLTTGVCQRRQSARFERPDEYEVLCQVLRTHPLFAFCRHDASMLQEIVDTFERHETQNGEMIVSPGDNCAFHVVVKGKAAADVGSCDALSVQENRPQEWGAGDYFGSEGLLYVLNPGDEGAAVRAASPPDASSSTTVTWALNRTLYQEVMRTFHDDAHSKLMAYLSQSPLFQHLPRARLLQLCERVERVTWDTSDRLLQRGEVPTDLFLLISGSVALMHVQRGRGDSTGMTHVRSTLLSAGDCVGDAELLLHCTTDEDDGGAAPKKLTAKPSCCTYAVKEPVQAIRIPIEDLLAALSWNDLQHMRKCSRSVRELELWKRQAQMQGVPFALVEWCFLRTTFDDGSGSDEDVPLLQGGVSDAASPLSELSDDSLQDVFVKGADATAFFLEQIFSRQTYRRADGRERGLSMATFTPRQRHPVGTVLFHVEYAAGGNSMTYENGALPPRDDGNDAAISRDTSAAVGFPRSPACLYAVFSGEITVVNSDTDEVIYSVSHGNTIGEDALLPPLQCCSATIPLRTHAVVSSPEGCEVFELNRRAFKEFLQRPYCEAFIHFCNVLCLFPFAECLPENYWRFLFHCTSEREAVSSDLISFRGEECKVVSLILDGRINAYVRSSAADSEGKSEENKKDMSVASFTAGDVVGGWEVMTKRPSNVAYVCVSRARLLCVPANSFAGLFRPAMPYLHSMWSEERYQRVMVVASPES
ncbi:hypothetical protein, unknown function [Leishmania tarentolae]|uniref:Cyclic nucleotide-binding domain-containing protein n=1 Tax=Leishmania tarentolae TaxID=5689 RepID=A0A640KMT5_LEITA|nr:hypothetical protein, unknown function [Leishmania tarentolae]